MAIYYSKNTGGFYDSAIHGKNIPAAALEITIEEYRALMHGQSQGKRISSDSDGRPVLIDSPPISVAGRRTTAKINIDIVVGKARARYVSAGQLIEEEYHLTRQQTLAWRAAGSLADSVPASIQAWADAAGITAEEAAASIEQIATYWESVLLKVRQLRLAGKASVDASANTADFDAVAQVYIDQLDAMKP